MAARVHKPLRNDRPVFSSEMAPHVDKTATVSQSQKPGLGPQKGLDTKTDWSTDCRL
jgi:hypothetical protein